MSSTGPTGPPDPQNGNPVPTGRNYINPPKALDLNMHNFITNTGDVDIPPSLNDVLNNPKKI